MRIGFEVLAIMALTSACGAAGDAGNLDDPEMSAPGNLDDHDVRAKLRDLASQTSAIAGVPSPQTMTAVWSPDHQVAEKIVSGSIVNDHVPVYVIEVTGGTFTSLDSPTGVSFTGTVLILTLNAQTFDGTDGSIATSAPDLHLIDPHVVNLLAD
jgi:hypothetical protein